jgi:diguanylate cyclase (GGDEF)-like protein
MHRDGAARRHSPFTGPKRAADQSWMQMKTRLPLNRMIQLGFAAIVALLLIVDLVAFRSVIGAAESARWVRHTGQVLEHLGVLRPAVEATESDYRDFAVSGDDAFLQAAAERTALLNSEQVTLRALTADNARQQQRLTDIAELVQRVVHRGETIAQLRRAQGIEAALDGIRKRQNDPVLEQFRAVASAMQDEERQLLHQRDANEARRAGQSEIALILGSGLAILIAALSGWTVLRDQAERKKAQDELTRLNRLYAMVSGINALGVQVRDRDALFSNACRIAVERGEFVMAWIGMVDRSTKKIVPMAWTGADDRTMAAIRTYLSTAAGSLQGTTLGARAIRDMAPVIANDVQRDESLAFGRMHAEAGVRSIAVLPLVVSGKAVGIFALYTSKPEFFDAAGISLLTELAGNVAFAIDHIEKQERLDRFAYYDELTGLANRNLFIDRLTQHMLSASGSGHKLAVFLIDLERFKKFNDSLGRAAGDSLLKLVAEWLAQSSGNVNLLARVGADQFAMVLPEVTYEAEVLRLLEKRIAGFMSHAFRVNDVVYRIAAKVGIVLYPEDGTDADTLFKNAEAAVKKAKVSGDRFLFYAQKMNETVPGSLGIENRLRQALEKEQFVLHYQPKVNLATGKITGAEALIRWNDPQSGLVPPANFISILEDTGLIHEVGRWALHKAIADHQRWLRLGLPAVRIAVNVSPLQLRHRRFVAQIEEAVGVAPGAAAGLELEITESLIMENVDLSIVSLLAIRALGVTIAIDDFGTGFSSLSYLSKLPVDTLKIDRSFVVDMASDSDGLTLVSVIINLAHALKLNVVAEGVATEEQLRQLRLMHCDEMQGFLYGKPVPVEIFEKKYLIGAATALA